MLSAPGFRPGIIPALAGNTWYRGGQKYGTSDHPRSRGEYCVWETPYPREGGSSPLSRGIRAALRQAVNTSGIIPALAGNTQWHRAGVLPGWDHPRSRGEYRRLNRQGPNAVGSSPLSRGIRHPADGARPGVGIIPALAGNTTCPCLTARQDGDHPRSRGEYGNAQLTKLGALGSSPLSRGILRGPSSICRRRRIIPALAGNTLVEGTLEGNVGDHPRSRGEYGSVDEVSRAS